MEDYIVIDAVKVFTEKTAKNLSHIADMIENGLSEDDKVKVVKELRGIAYQLISSDAQILNKIL